MKRKKLKQILSSLLTISMLISIFQVPVLAEALDANTAQNYTERAKVGLVYLGTGDMPEANAQLPKNILSDWKSGQEFWVGVRMYGLKTMDTNTASSHSHTKSHFTLFDTSDESEGNQVGISKITSGIDYNIDYVVLGKNYTGTAGGDDSSISTLIPLLNQWSGEVGGDMNGEFKGFALDPGASEFASTASDENDREANTVSDNKYMVKYVENKTKYAYQSISAVDATYNAPFSYFSWGDYDAETYEDDLDKPSLIRDDDIYTIIVPFKLAEDASVLSALTTAPFAPTIGAQFGILTGSDDDAIWSAQWSPDETYADLDLSAERYNEWTDEQKKALKIESNLKNHFMVDNFTLFPDRYTVKYHSTGIAAQAGENVTKTANDTEIKDLSDSAFDNTTYDLNYSGTDKTVLEESVIKPNTEENTFLNSPYTKHYIHAQDQVTGLYLTQNVLDENGEEVLDDNYENVTEEIDVQDTLTKAENFEGWYYKDSDGKLQAFTASSSLKDLADSATGVLDVYANYQDAQKTVVYHAGTGGTWKDGTDKNDDGNHEENVSDLTKLDETGKNAAVADLLTPSTTGQVFAGWVVGTDSTAGTDAYADGLTLEDGQTTIDLWATYAEGYYAHFQILNDANKPTGTGVTQYEKKFPIPKTGGTIDSGIVTGTNAPVPSEGHKFKGWRKGELINEEENYYIFTGANVLTADATTKKYTIDGPLTGDIYFYPEWDKADDADAAEFKTLTFDKNADDATLGSPESIKYKGNDTILTATDGGAFPSEPTRDGYTFAGWYNNEKGDGDKLEGDTKLAEFVVEDVDKAFAKWEKATDTDTENIVEVSFATNNDENGKYYGGKYIYPDGTTDGTINKRVIALGGALGDEFPAYSDMKYGGNDGKEFIGWYTQANAGGSQIKADTAITADIATAPPAGSPAGTPYTLTLYPYWAETVTVTIEMNKGKYSTSGDTIDGTEETPKKLFVKVAKGKTIADSAETRIGTTNFEAATAATKELTSIPTSTEVTKKGYKFDGFSKVVSDAPEKEDNNIVYTTNETTFGENTTIRAHWSTTIRVTLDPEPEYKPGEGATTDPFKDDEITKKLSMNPDASTKIDLSDSSSNDVVDHDNLNNIGNYNVSYATYNSESRTYEETTDTNTTAKFFWKLSKKNTTDSPFNDSFTDLNFDDYGAEGANQEWDVGDGDITITFDFNGGKYKDSAATTISITIPKGKTIPEEVLGEGETSAIDKTVPTGNDVKRTGFEFKGFKAVGTDGEDKDKPVGDLITDSTTFDEDTTVKVLWEATITGFEFDPELDYTSDGTTGNDPYKKAASGNDPATIKVTVSDGTSTATPEDSALNDITNYSYKIEDSATTPNDVTSAGAVKPGDYTYTLTAWNGADDADAFITYTLGTPNPSDTFKVSGVKLIFNANSGTVDTEQTNDSLDPIEVVPGHSVAQRASGEGNDDLGDPTTLPAAVRAGYTFEGWAKAKLKDAADESKGYEPVIKSGSESKTILGTDDYELVDANTAISETTTVYALWSTTPYIFFAGTDGKPLDIVLTEDVEEEKTNKDPREDDDYKDKLVYRITNDNGTTIVETDDAGITAEGNYEVKLTQNQDEGDPQVVTESKTAGTYNLVYTWTYGDKANHPTADFTVISSVKGSSYTVSKGDVTVKFDLNKGKYKNAETAPADVTVTQGSNIAAAISAAETAHETDNTVVIPVFPKETDMSREGYIFGGWGMKDTSGTPIMDDAETNPDYKKFVDTTKVDRDITVYAIWKTGVKVEFGSDVKYLDNGTARDPFEDDEVKDDVKISLLADSSATPVDATGDLADISKYGYKITNGTTEVEAIHKDTYTCDMSYSGDLDDFVKIVSYFNPTFTIIDPDISLEIIDKYYVYAENDNGTAKVDPDDMIPLVKDKTDPVLDPAPTIGPDLANNSYTTTFTEQNVEGATAAEFIDEYPTKFGTYLITIESKTMPEGTQNYNVTGSPNTADPTRGKSHLLYVYPDTIPVNVSIVDGEKKTGEGEVYTYKIPVAVNTANDNKKGGTDWDPQMARNTISATGTLADGIKVPTNLPVAGVEVAEGAQDTNDFTFPEGKKFAEKKWLKADATYKADTPESEVTASTPFEPQFTEEHYVVANYASSNVTITFNDTKDEADAAVAYTVTGGKAIKDGAKDVTDAEHPVEVTDVPKPTPPAGQTFAGWYPGDAEDSTHAPTANKQTKLNFLSSITGYEEVTKDTVLNADQTLYALYYKNDLNELTLKEAKDGTDKTGDEVKYKDDRYLATEPETVFKVNDFEYWTAVKSTSPYVYFELTPTNSDALITITNETTGDTSVEDQAVAADGKVSAWSALEITSDGSPNVIKVTIKDEDTEGETVYTFNVLYSNAAKLELAYGNSPVGEIRSNLRGEGGDKYNTKEKQDEAIAEFKSSRIFADTAAGVKFHVNAWKSYDNEDADIDETAIFIYQGQSFLDPGFRTAKNSRNENITNLKKITMELTLQRINNYGVLTYTPDDDLTSVTISRTCDNLLIGEIDDVNNVGDKIVIRPDVYKITYKYEDEYTGEDIEVKRKVIVVARRGDMRMDQSNSVGNADATQIRINVSKYTNDANINTLYKYRICDANNDGSLTSNDATAVIGNTIGNKFYKELPKSAPTTEPAQSGD